MNKNLSYTNYITGTELENGKILLYAGKPATESITAKRVKWLADSSLALA